MRYASPLAAAVAALAVGLTGCSEPPAPTAAPQASKVTEGKSKAGRSTPAGSGVMPKEPGR